LQAISSAKPEPKTTRNIMIAVMLIALLVLCGVGYLVLQSSKRTLWEQSPVIEYRAYQHFSTVFPKGATIHVTVRVEEGGPIDALLMSSGEFLYFENLVKGEVGSFQYFKEGSALNVKSIDYEFTIPSDDRYFIVLNNAGHIEGGAVPIGPVTVYVKIVVSV